MVFLPLSFPWVDAKVTVMTMLSVPEISFVFSERLDKQFQVAKEQPKKAMTTAFDREISPLQLQNLEPFGSKCITSLATGGSVTGYAINRTLPMTKTQCGALSVMVLPAMTRS
jgi:hypothetical protein